MKIITKTVRLFAVNSFIAMVDFASCHIIETICSTTYNTESRIRTWATLVKNKSSHHYATPAFPPPPSPKNAHDD